MAKNIFNSLKRDANLGRNAFDLSRKHVFSAKAGQLIPCLALETVPNGHYEIDVKDLVRTNVIKTDAFARIGYSYDFYFVPYSQLWHKFNEFYAQREDKISSLEQGRFCVPYFLISYFFDSDSVNSSDVHGFRGGAFKLLDMLGYGNFYSMIRDYEESDYNQWSFEEGYGQDYALMRLNPFRALAYQKIWSDFYRNPYFDTTVDAECFNVDNIQCTSVSNSGISFEQANKMFTMRYRQWKKDMFTGVLPQPAMNGVSVSFLSLWENNNSSFGVGQGNIQLNTFDEKRSSFLTKPLTLSSNSQSINTSAFDNGSDNYVYEGSNGIVYGELENGDLAGHFGIDVLSLRKAEALQKWSETVLRQGYRTNDQFEGIFGVAPRFDSKNHPLFLGSYQGRVNIDEVIQTGSEDGGAFVGNIKGKGIGTSSGSKITFDASDFGVIMCVMSFLPESEYNSFMLDKANRVLEPFEYFNPMFDDLGFEAIPAADALFVKPIGQSTESRLRDSFNATLGFLPRYYHHKTAVDKVFGNFFNTNGYHGNNPMVNSKGILSDWVAPRSDFQLAAFDGQLALPDFYVNPSVLDSIFAQQADSSIVTDQFMVNAYFDITAVQPMSVLGLPQWN